MKFADVWVESFHLALIHIEDAENVKIFNEVRNACHNKFGQTIRQRSDFLCFDVEDA